MPNDSIDFEWHHVQLRIVSSWLHLNSSTNINSSEYEEFFFKDNQVKIPKKDATQFKKPGRNPVLALIWEGDIWEGIEQSAFDLKNLDEQASDPEDDFEMDVSFPYYIL